MNAKLNERVEELSATVTELKSINDSLRYFHRDFHRDFHRGLFLRSEIYQREKNMIEISKSHRRALSEQFEIIADIKRTEVFSFFVSLRLISL